MRLYAQQNCVYTQNLLPPSQDTTAILQISDVFIMEYVLSNLLLVLNCKFGDLALKTKERLSGEEEERKRGKKISQMIFCQKILFLWNHSISQKYGETAYIEKVKKKKFHFLVLF